MYKILTKLRTTNFSLFFELHHNLPIKFNTTTNKITTATTEVTNLDNETVVVINGSTGVGLCLAVKLAKLNANVGIWDKDEQALDNTQKYAKSNLGINLVPFVCDITKKGDIYKAAEETKKHLGNVTTIVNTVMQASEKLFLDIPDCDLEHVFQSNLLSQLWLTKAFLPDMVKSNNGRFITISSMAGHMGIHKLTDYCASNAAAINFMIALRAELDNEGSSGIKTTIICPYFVKTYKLHKNTKLRFVQGVNKDEVAERTIQAMVNNEFVVFLPGWFKYSSTLRWFCPNCVSQFFKNVLIKDTNSNSVSKPLMEIKTSDYMAIDNLPERRVNDLSNIAAPSLTTTQDTSKNKEM